MSEPDRAIERLEAALTDAGAGHVPPPNWEARVLAAADAAAASSRRPRWWLFALPALAAAAAIVIYVSWPPGARSTEPLQLALALERGGPVVRGTSAHVGDTLRATATGGAAKHAVWIYRDERDLVAICTGDAPCTFTITARGDYSVVALASDAALPTPHGTLDTDVDAAAKTGAHYKIEPVAVR